MDKCDGCKSKLTEICSFTNFNCPCKECLVKAICIIGLSDEEGPGIENCPTFALFYKQTYKKVIS
jgi:hypothetical protein